MVALFLRRTALRQPDLQPEIRGNKLEVEIARPPGRQRSGSRDRDRDRSYRDRRRSDSRDQ